MLRAVTRAFLRGIMEKQCVHNLSKHPHSSKDASPLNLLFIRASSVLQPSISAQQKVLEGLKQWAMTIGSVVLLYFYEVSLLLKIGQHLYLELYSPVIMVALH